MVVHNISESLCLFSQSHLWLYPDQDDWLVGLSDFAQDQRSDVIYIELPTISRLFLRDELNIVIESVKTAESLPMPVSGVITRVNAALSESPQLVNQSPYGDGWLYAMRLSDERELDGLMSFADYDVWLDQ